ncbi:ribosomal protein L13e-domain-containing protein [Gloeopeniophorella convolvens]|nr:ribosomal protein L13e-domain-containing protein [Gloeopeniophorella convolvens]
MGFGKNNVLHANHFRKDWQRRVKTWFDQPGRKLRRRQARKAKVAALGVRPLSLLRPAVRGQTVRYNTKLREGRGFTLGELKEAGIGRKAARGLGVVVDHRRRNQSVEGKSINVERLKAYKERLVVFPRKTGKPKKGDSSAEDLNAPTTRQTLPIPSSFVAEEPRKITQEERDFNAYKTLRNSRAEARYEGARKIRAAKASHIFTHPLAYPLILFFARIEGGRGGSQEEVIMYLLLTALFYALPCPHSKTRVLPGSTQYMPVCTHLALRLRRWRLRSISAEMGESSSWYTSS